MDIKKVKKGVSQYFSTRPEIIVGYIFGSMARREESKLSDIDIAILIDEKKASGTSSYRYKSEILSELMGIVKTDKLDLVILNESPLLLASRVMRDGLVLHSKNELKRIRFEVKIMSSYLDRKFYYDRHTNLSLANIAREGIL